MPITTSLAGANTSRPSRWYATAFPSTEGSLSEGGVWTASATDTTVCAVTTISGQNVCHGTQAGGSFDDSQAVLSGFGASHEVEGIVYKKAGLNGTNREVEILLSWTNGYAPFTPPGGTFGTTTAKGYEINIHHAGSYANIGQWKALPALVSTGVGPTPVAADGDRFRARVTYRPDGTTDVTGYWNDVQFITVHDTSPPPVGNPGIGFYISSGAGNDEFGFKSVVARTL